MASCISTPLYQYRRLSTPGNIDAHENPVWHIQKPFGFLWFPKKIALVPRAWVAATGNPVFYRQPENGGHSTAIEQTRVLWEDLEAFVKQVWTSNGRKN
jgi:microsomal epoxide hydrolase